MFSKGQCDCIVGVYRPFSTALMSNHPHSLQTHGTWVSQPSYAFGRLKTVWKEEPVLIMISKVVSLYCWVFHAVFNITYVKSPALFTYSCVLGDSTQLLNSTEHTVTKGAIARPAFRGRFICIVGCFRPFSTSFQSHQPVRSHTRDPWMNNPSYAIDLNTLWQKKQLPVML